MTPPAYPPQWVAQHKPTQLMTRPAALGAPSQAETPAVNDCNALWKAYEGGQLANSDATSSHRRKSDPA